VEAAQRDPLEVRLVEIRESGLRNSFGYSYTVLPIGANSAPRAPPGGSRRPRAEPRARAACERNGA